MNAHDRRALVAMGQDMARAREVLTATERRSIETLYTLEFKQLTNVRKSPKEPHEPKPRLGTRNAGRRDSEIAADLLTRRREGDYAPLNACGARRYGAGHGSRSRSANDDRAVVY